MCIRDSFPYYLTKEKIEKAKNLKIAITAGIGSDHVDLQAAMDHKIDVVEVTFCNSRSVAEHIVMMIVSMVRDYHNQHRIVNEGGHQMVSFFLMHLNQFFQLQRFQCAFLQHRKTFELHQQYSIHLH